MQSCSGDWFFYYCELLTSICFPFIWNFSRKKIEKKEKKNRKKRKKILSMSIKMDLIVIKLECGAYRSYCVFRQSTSKWVIFPTPAALSAAPPAARVTSLSCPMSHNSTSTSIVWVGRRGISPGLFEEQIASSLWQEKREKSNIF